MVISWLCGTLDGAGWASAHGTTPEEVHAGAMVVVGTACVRAVPNLGEYRRLIGGKRPLVETCGHRLTIFARHVGYVVLRLSRLKKPIDDLIGI